MASKSSSTTLAIQCGDCPINPTETCTRIELHRNAEQHVIEANYQIPGCLSIYLSLPACLPAFLAGWVAGCLSVCLSVSLSLSVCLCLSLGLSLCVCVSVCLSQCVCVCAIDSMCLYMPHSSLAFLVSVSHQPETPRLITDDLVTGFRPKQYVSHTQKPGLDRVSQRC